MAILQRTYVLTGARQGKTCKLKVGTKFIQFENGEVTLQGDAENIEGYEKYMAKCFQAYPKDSLELKKALEGGEQDGKCDPYENEIYRDTRAIPSSTRPYGQKITQVFSNDSIEPTSSGDITTKHIPTGDGHQDTRVPTNQLTEEQQRIKSAVISLDPTIDENWTAQGLPQVSVVENILGSSGVTRSILNNVAPGFNREKAHELLGEGKA